MSLFKNKKLLYGAAGVLALIIIVVVTTGGNTKKVETLVVHPGDFVQAVSVSGKVVAGHDVDLGFSSGGRVAGVYVKVGDHVGMGSVLAEEENADLRAALQAEEAKLASLSAGTRPEQIAVTEAEVAGDKAALFNAIQSAYATADGAIRNDVDQFISNPRSGNPQLAFAVSDSSIKNAVEVGRASVEQTLSSWQTSLATLSASGDLAAAAASAQSALTQVSSLLANAQSAITRGNPTGAVSQSTLDGYAADIATARASITTAVSTLSTASANLAGAQKSLALQEAGTTPEDIAAQQALVNQAKATLGKTLIVAPFSGVITVVNAKVGGTLAVNAPALSMIGSDLQIESYVPEVNVALVAVHNPASATLDAYGTGVSFPASVASIDPAETLRDGVSTYRTILLFSQKDDRIRAGMTANVIITTAERHDVIAVPEGVVTTKNGKKYVTIQSGKTTLDREVTTGATSSIGTIEILSGLADGETIVVPAH